MMKRLNNIQSKLFLLGGFLMVVGAGCFSLMWQQGIACWIFLLGALLFTTLQSIQTYNGNSFVIKRLKNIQNIANIFFIISAFLMIDTHFQFFRPLFGNVITYFTYVYNKWVVMLLIAALLEIYTTHRIDSEIKKDRTKSK